MAADIINPHTGRPVEWGAYDDGHFTGDPYAWQKVLSKAGKWDGFTSMTPDDVEALRSAGYFDQSRLDGPGEVDPGVLARYQATDWQRLRDMGLQMGLARKDYNLTQYIRDKDGNVLDETTWKDKGSSMHRGDYATAAAVLGAGALAGYGLASAGIGAGAGGTLGTIAPSAATAASSALPTVGTMATPTASSLGIGSVGGGGIGTMGTIGAGSIGSTALAPVGQMAVGTTAASQAVPALASVGAGSGSILGKAALVRAAMPLVAGALAPSVRAPAQQDQMGSAGAAGSSFVPPTRQPSWQSQRVADLRARFGRTGGATGAAAPVSATPPRVGIPKPPTSAPLTASPTMKNTVINPAQRDMADYTKAWSGA